jgi:transcriptional regulator of acetoin/glycerol metabolism
MDELYGSREDIYGTVQLPVRARKIMEALEETGGSRTKAAAKLGISKSTLWRQMKKYELENY